MKIGASTLASNNLEEFLDLCSSLNLDYVEIVKTFPNHDFDKSLLESYDFNYSIHSPLIDMNICSLTDSIREASMDELKSSMNDAEDIGARFVVVHPGKISYLGRPYEDEIYDLCVESFKEIRDFSEELDVIPLIENMPLIPGFMFMDIYHLDEVLQDLSMFMTFDVGHAFTYGFEENEMYTPRVKHVHIHDNNGGDDSHYTLGEGSIDFNRVFNIYDEKGYDGTYIIEANDNVSLKNSMEYLKTNNYI